MAVLQLRVFPDPVLREVARPVSEITDELRSLIQNMIETMYQVGGVGLAAPQVGVSLRIAVMDPSAGMDPGELHVMINPEIVEQENSTKAQEGCLSAPGVSEEVERAERVRVRYLDLEGKEQELEAKNLLARIVQHEVDHLDGHLYWDCLSKVKRDVLKQHYKRTMEEKD